MSNYHADTASRNCHAGSTRTRVKSSVACRSSAQSLDATTRSRFYATVASMTLISSAPQCVVRQNLAVTFAHANAATAAHVKGSISSRRITVTVNRNVDVISQTAGIHVLLPAMAKRHVRFANKLATSSAVTRNARRNAVSRALHAQKRNAHHAARMPSATCHVLLLVTGCLAHSVAQSYWRAATSAHLSVARIVQARNIVKPAALTLSRTFVPTSSCSPLMLRSMFRRALVFSCLVATSSRSKAWME